MNENQDDNSNNNEDYEPSKLPKPASLEQYFGKVGGNIKILQFEAKLKPNPNDKFTKLTYKTQCNKKLDWGFLPNSKLKFEAKEGRTKVSINTKLFDRPLKNSRAQRQEDLQVIDDKRDNDKKGKKENSDKDKQKEEGDFEMTFSTAYDDYKLNLKLKQRGELSIKLAQSIDIIPNSLKGQLQYLWEYKNNSDTKNCIIEVLYNSGVRKWYENSFLDTNFFHKNQTKIKAKIGTSSETEFKISSINHFGKCSKQLLPEIQEEKIPVSDEKQELQNANNQIVQKSSNQKIAVKLNVQHKLTFSKKGQRDFNLKSYANCQFVPFKKSVRLEMGMNQQGISSIQLKTLIKSWQSYIFGFSGGFNCNNSGGWHKKWEIVAQKHGLKNFGNIGFSLTQKLFGFRLIRKFKNSGRVELIASKKYSTWKQTPVYGIKVSLNL